MINSDDFLLVYRAQFPQTMLEAENVKGDTGKVVFGTAIGVAIAIGFFGLIVKFCKLLHLASVSPCHASLDLNYF